MKNENFTTIEKSLGNNTISYIGAINKISPKNTAWKFQLFGGITLIDDAKTNHLTKK